MGKWKIKSRLAEHRSQKKPLQIRQISPPSHGHIWKHISPRLLFPCLKYVNHYKGITDLVWILLVMWLNELGKVHSQVSDWIKIKLCDQLKGGCWHNNMRWIVLWGPIHMTLNNVFIFFFFFYHNFRMYLFLLFEIVPILDGYAGASKSMWTRVDVQLWDYIEWQLNGKSC